MDVCVCCGNYVPEGSQVCWSCIRKTMPKNKVALREAAVILTSAAMSEEVRECRNISDDQTYSARLMI